MSITRTLWPALLLALVITACGGGGVEATTEVPALPETAAPGDLPPEADVVTEPPLEEAATEPVGPTPTATVIPPEGAAAGPDDPSSLLNLMAAGEIEVQSATAIAGAQPVGQALRVTLANPGAAGVLVTLPCGLTLLPAAAGPRLMVAEPVSVTVAAGGSMDVIPTTMSLDPDQPLPPEGAEYTVGSLAEDWLDQCP